MVPAVASRTFVTVASQSAYDGFACHTWAMQPIVLSRRRVILGGLVLVAVLLLGARFLVRVGTRRRRRSRRRSSARPRRWRGAAARRRRRRGSSSTWSAPCGGRALPASPPGRGSPTRSRARAAPRGGPTLRRSTSPRRVADGEQVLVPARLPRRGGGRTGRARAGRAGRAGPAERGDGRAARRAPRDRPRHGAEDRRLPRRPRCVSLGRRPRRRSRASALRASSSCEGWWCRESGAARLSVRARGRGVPRARAVERGAGRRRSRSRCSPSGGVRVPRSWPTRARASPCSRSRSCSRAGGGEACASTRSTRACSLPLAGQRAAARVVVTGPARGGAASTCACPRS